MQPFQPSFQPFSRSSSLALGFRALGWRSLLGARAPSGDLQSLAAVLPADVALLGLGMRVTDRAGDLRPAQDAHHIGWTPYGGNWPLWLLTERRVLPAGGTEDVLTCSASRPCVHREAPELCSILAAGTDPWGLWRAQL